MDDEPNWFKRELIRSRSPISFRRYLLYFMIISTSTSASSLIAYHYASHLIFLRQWMIIIPILSSLTYLSWPWISVASRREKIDLGLHHACAFLYAMSKSGMQITDALESLYEYKAIYGEVAEEFGIAVRRARVFRESHYRALKYVAETTASKKLREFIDAFLTSTRTSMNASSLFTRPAGKS